MPHRIERISGLYTDGNLNRIYCCYGCGISDTVFQNVHNTDLNITYFDVDTTGSGVTVSLLSINGAPPSFPFLLPEGETCIFEFEVCWDGVTTPLGSWLGHFITVEHGPENDFEFPMLCVTPATYSGWSAGSIDFVDVPSGIPTSQTIEVQGTVFTQSFSPILAGCTGVTVTNPVIIPAEGTGSMTVTWTPPSPGSTLSCSVDDDCGTTIPITGNSVSFDCDASVGVCCLDAQIETDNNYLDTVTSLCDSDVEYDASAILDKKTVVYYFKHKYDLISGQRFYFNTVLFSNDGSEFATISSIPSIAWYIQYSSAQHAIGVDYNMNLIGTGANLPTQKNFQATFTPLDVANGIFKIKFTFYLVADILAPIGNFVFPNQSKFQKASINNATNFSNNLASVYLNNKYLTSIIYVSHPLAPGLIELNTRKISIPFTSRFYNKGLYNGVSEFTNPNFVLSRTIGLVSELSTFENTKITFTISVDTGLYTGVEAIVFHMYDMSIISANSDFLTATDSSRSEITNIAGTGVLDNHLILPSTITALGGDVYEATCYVDTALVATHNYMVCAIVYAQDGVTVNTFKSRAYGVRKIPDYDCTCVPDIKSYWGNYFNTISENDYRPVGMERIQHRLMLSGGDFADCIASWGLDEEIPDWRRVLRKVTLRIYKKVNNFPPPQSGQQYVTFFQYGKYAATQTSFGQWSSSDNFSATPLDTDTLQLEITEQRVRWEDTPFDGQVFYAKVDTYMDKLSAGANSQNYINTLGIVNSWIDEDVYFEYEFNFDLTQYFGQQFIFSIVKAFKARAISFENVNSGFPDIIENVVFEGFSPVINAWVPLSNNITPLSYSLIRLTWEANTSGWFNVFINKFPFTVAQIEDSNASPSNTGLIQYWQDPIINSQSLAFGVPFVPAPHYASVVLNPNEFENTSYSICAYWTERNSLWLCRWLNVHVRNGGSAQLQMITFGNYIQVSLFGASTGAFIDMSSTYNPGGLPLVGQTYYLYYDFGIQTTQSIAFRFGQNSGAGLPDLVIPVGSESGIIQFVWPAGTSGLWRMSLTGGGTISGYWKIGIGSEECDYAPWDETL
jgi:hypothetical protein